MKKIVLLLTSAVCGIIIFHLCLSAYFYYLKQYFPIKNDVSYRLLIQYGKLCFSLLMIASSMTFFLKSKLARLSLLLILFLLYSFYWYPSLQYYPYRISSLLLISAIVYSGICLFIRYRVLKNESQQLETAKKF